MAIGVPASKIVLYWLTKLFASKSPFFEWYAYRVWLTKMALICRNRCVEKKVGSSVEWIPKLSDCKRNWSGSTDQAQITKSNAPKSGNNQNRRLRDVRNSNFRMGRQICVAVTLRKMRIGLCVFVFWLLLQFVNSQVKRWKMCGSGKNR